nr:8 kDa protein [Sweet potato chlorotic stunt virus]
MDFSELIEKYGVERISSLTSRLLEIKRTGVGLVNLLLNLINENFIYFDSNRSKCGFEKEDHVLILQIIPLLRI